MPKGLTAKGLAFTGVNKVEIKGPWEESQWAHQLILLDSQDIQLFLDLISKSIPQNKEYTQRDSVTKYIIIFYYEGGEIVRGRLYVGESSAKLVLDPFPNWFYDTLNELRTFVEQSLR